MSLSTSPVAATTQPEWDAATTVAAAAVDDTMQEPPLAGVEPPQDPPAAAPPAPAPAAPVYYKHADLDTCLAPSAFLALEKVGGLYVARLATPLLVQTPPVTLASPLDDEDGTPLPHVHVTLPRDAQAFAQRVEDLVLGACLANKETWFRRALEDATLRASFKPFFKAGEGTLKVKVPRDALVFDDAGTLLCHGDVAVGTSVRCLLELSCVCFGRTEFGAMWSLRQAQRAPAPPPPPRCMIDPAAEDCGAAAPAGAEPKDFDFQEFI